MDGWFGRGTGSTVDAELISWMWRRKKKLFDMTTRRGTGTNGVAFNLPTADGNDGQVLTTDGAGNLSFANASASAFLSGMVMPYAGTSAPTGWVLCYGQSLNTYTYKDLHAVVSKYQSPQQTLYVYRQ